MNIELVEAQQSDLQFMREMLYEAIYWRPNPNKPSIEEGLADLGSSYALVEWGKRDGDTAVMALVDAKPAGAAWYRFYDDEKNIRGYYEETIPVIVIAVHENYRRKGIGEKMIEWLIEHAKKENIRKISLMVSKDNHAIKLYRKFGFEEHEDKGDSLLMVRELNKYSWNPLGTK
jgi:ribosomal protein S18 acetylase RimI-like enzyme